jgi:hypothetical protein
MWQIRPLKKVMDHPSPLLSDTWEFVFRYCKAV